MLGKLWEMMGTLKKCWKYVKHCQEKGQGMSSNKKKSLGNVNKTHPQKQSRDNMKTSIQTKKIKFGKNVFFFFIATKDVRKDIT
jgi:hypothetical protein